MKPERVSEVTLRPWAVDDLPLLRRLLGDPAMMEHLGGPETPERWSEGLRNLNPTDPSG